MKTSTCTKNGKSQNAINNLKEKEITMKSSTYKRVNGKVVEISNNINKLEEISPEGVLMACYDDLFKRIDKGNKVVNFIKTKEYKDSLLDSLQTVMAEILTTKDYLQSNNIKAYFKKAFFNRVVDNIRHEITYDIFKKDFSEYCQDSDYGVTKEYLQEMIMDIKRTLLISEYEIFKLYHLQGLSAKVIAIKLEVSRQTIDNRVKQINNKIEKLNFKVLYDSRYVSHFSGKKKRQHKRKVMTKKEIIDLSSNVVNISKENYQVPVKENRKALDLSKLPHSQAHGMKDIVIDKSSYHTIANGNFVYNEINHVIQNVYQNSCILNMPVVKYSSKEYRRKREVRKYQNNLKVGLAYQKKSLSTKHGRYLAYMTD